MDTSRKYGDGLMVLSSYDIKNKIFEGSGIVIYKASSKEEPNRLVTIKMLKGGSLSEYKRAQFKQRIEHLKVLNEPSLITPLLVNENDGSYLIIQDNYDGVSLDKLIQTNQSISLKVFFAIACNLARSLEKVHEAGIIHGGIKPHNILVNPGTFDIRLIDFLSILDVRDVSHFIYNPYFIRGTLAYTSPEQTGRINHRVVFSSDLYSLGVIFYEMLTGNLPFYSEDPLELIHSHLADNTPAIHELNHNIPVILSKIIAKLMLKEPEKRYQSAGGLLSDLTMCRDEFATSGTIREFPLESGVSANRVVFISKMVGRDSEAKMILKEYDQVIEGQFRSIFISGLSGIGKTRLIQELQKPIIKHRGYFTSGKFDVYQKNIPYSSLIQALRNLMRTFLTESDERVEHWKKKILKAVEKNGKVLTDVIPELEALIGPQPEVKTLPPVESMNRFHDTFDKFLTCLASKESPLTLFIDDLQWCDSASFDFLANVFDNYKDHPYLFLIGAYRHNEVDPSHPLSKLICNVLENKRPLEEIRLSPLKPEHCHEMVSYILDCPLKQSKTLADFIINLSEGNPLFVSESLSYLYNENLLYLDEDRQWQWNIEKVRESHMPTTVVALFSSKIRKFEPELIGLLEYCACMGNTFSPEVVASIKRITLLETFQMLKPVLGQGLLIENKNKLQFIHDKVQEATLSAIPAERRREIHWEVGNHLLSAVREGANVEKLDNLFTIVSHLNMGKEKNLDVKTAYLLSDLNYHAGNKALDALATEAANEYFKFARELLPHDCWSKEYYKRTFRIFQMSAKTELMCGKYENSEKLLNYLLDHAKTDVDKAECLAEQTTSLSSVGNFIKAIETANRGLAYFGKSIPDLPEEAEAKRKVLMDDIASKKIDVWETILNMPFTNDRKSKIELSVYSELIPDLYMSGQVSQLYLSAAQSTQHCLSGGMDESVIYSFSIMGLQKGEQGEFEQAFKYEDLARELSAKYPNTFGATRGMNGIVWCNMHSRSHPRQIADYCLKSIQCGKNCGDLYNAGLSYGPLMWNLQVQGSDMPAIEDYSMECLQFSNRYHLSFSSGLAEAMHAGWIEPMKKGYTPIDMVKKIQQWESDNHIASAGSYYVHLAMAHYYFGEYEKAEECLVEVRKYLSGLTDNVLKRQWHVFLVLNRLKLFEDGSGAKDKSALLEEIDPIIEKVETWASLGPLIKPYLAFLYAEKERVTGEFNEARSLYLDAINSAHSQGYTLLEGHVNESFGEFLQKAGHCSAKIYFLEAGRLYRKCRAERKEINLLEKYSRYSEEETPPIASAETRVTPPLDINYLMKSSFTISAEIEQNSLLEKIMEVVIDSSHAQDGYLLLEEKGRLIIRAESHITKKQISVLDKNFEDVDDICKAIVRYVSRTGDRVVLNNACQEDVFKDNTEVMEMRLHSVLCLPVNKQSRMIGVLYLENRQSDGVFTPKKTQMTELLTTQAAISLENVRLLDEMKETEEALRKSQVNMAKAQQTAHIGDWEWDMKTNELSSSDEHYRIYGLTPGKYPIDTFLNLVHPDDRQYMQDSLVKALNGDKDYNVEYRVIRPDGSTRILHGEGEVVYDEQGQPRGMFGIAQDITERKRAEEMQRESDVRFRSLIQNSSDIIRILDREWRIIYDSPSSEKILGYPADSLLGRFPMDFIHPDDLERVKNDLGEVINKRNPGKPTEFRIMKADGEYVDVESIGINMIGVQGVDGIVVTTRPITERKRAELERERLLEQLKAKTSELENANEELEIKSEEMAAQAEEIECANEELRNNNDELQMATKSLHEAQVYLESLISYANAPIIVWDPGFTITRFNQAFERLSGYMAYEVLGKDLTILFPNDSRDESLDKIKKTLEGEQWESVEIPIQHKYGSIRIALWNSANIYDDNKNLIATIAQGQDITERKQAETDMEEAKAQSELYLDLMGHDISNLHQIMMINLDIVQELLDTKGKLEYEDKELINSMARTFDRANRLIDNVRKLQKLKSGDYSLESIDLSRMLEDVLKTYSNIPGRDIKINHIPNYDCIVKATPLLKDVFSNLIDNAVKHSGDPVEIWVAVHKVGLNGSSYYRVAIEDNGNGIPDDKKDEVFQRFKRGQTKARGTGLGLYLVKSLVESLGGYVEVQNRVLVDHSKGTRFLIYLPVIGEKNA